MTPFFYFVEDTENILTKMLEDIGFINVKVKIHSNSFVYEIENWKGIFLNFLAKNTDIFLSQTYF